MRHRKAGLLPTTTRNLQPVTIPDNDLLDQTFQVVLFLVFGIDVDIAFGDKV